VKSARGPLGFWPVFGQLRFLVFVRARQSPWERARLDAPLNVVLAVVSLPAAGIWSRPASTLRGSTVLTVAAIAWSWFIPVTSLSSSAWQPSSFKEA
jgi:hypothetical protein